MRNLCDLQNVSGKIVLVRVDWNVPMDENGNIADDSKLRQTLPTFLFLLKHNVKIVVFTHFGRPKKSASFMNYSLYPIMQAFRKLMDVPVFFFPECVGDKIIQFCRNRLDINEIVVLENLRFHEGETGNDEAFAKALASLGDVFVNEAFASSHRKHASIAGVPKFLPSFAGLHFQKEMSIFQNLCIKKKCPFMIVLGGKKLETKLSLISSLAEHADTIFLVGAIAHVFCFIENLRLFKSISVESRKYFSEAEVILHDVRNKGKRLLLPLDHVVVDAVEKVETARILDFIPEGALATDIGPKTRKMLHDEILSHSSVFWNGTAGIFELEAYSQGTKTVVRALEELDGTSIIGGGETVAAARKFGEPKNFTFLSSGGGAGLKFLESGGLLGIDVLCGKQEG